MITTHAKTLLAAATVSFFLSGSIGHAEGQNPNVGKDAPDLNVAGWATQKALTQETLNDRPYVLEFWATWCPPCRQSIPHLNDVSQRLEPFGLRVLGLSDESLDQVKPFAAQMGMVYYVGAGHKMQQGLEFRGIPFAAAVGTDGKVAWAGHPMDPVFEEKLWDLTRDYAPASLQPALDKAAEGSLGPVYAMLKTTDGDDAETARKTIETNLALRLELADALEGLEKYNAFHDIYKLYDGVPGANTAKERMEAMLEDTDVMQAVEQQKPLQELQAKVQDIRSKAMQLEEDESRQAAMRYYAEALLPVFKKFAADHPDHPETTQIKQAVTQIEEQLKTMQTSD
ncbi:MAG: TlpA family protein disulfide reductase [Candidatus Pacebacteria bacterium]|nr:TlpA family protein disulfide reductase [Candidatus Paceibacterota bacterium]